MATAAPSPAAVATYLELFRRMSPAANIPGTEVSKRPGAAVGDSCSISISPAASGSGAGASWPVRTKPQSSSATAPPRRNSELGTMPMNTNTPLASISRTAAPFSSQTRTDSNRSPPRNSRTSRW